LIKLIALLEGSEVILKAEICLLDWDPPATWIFLRALSLAELCLHVFDYIPMLVRDLAKSLRVVEQLSIFYYPIYATFSSIPTAFFIERLSWFSDSVT
jgi:hypothetical protein